MEESHMQKPPLHQPQILGQQHQPSNHLNPNLENATSGIEPHNDEIAERMINMQMGQGMIPMAMGGNEEIPITLLGALPLMYPPDDKKEFLGELPSLVLDYGIRHWDARSRLVEEFGGFYHIPPPFMFRYQLRLFLNELENWVHNDEQSLLIERVIILEQCCDIYHSRGQLVDVTSILRNYIEQLVISPLYFSDGKDFVDSTCVMYLDESGGPPVLFKWRDLVQDVIRNLIDVFSHAGGEGLKKNFPKHICYNRIMEFLDPLLKEFLYQESHLEKIMKEYHMLKGMVLNNKTNKQKRSRKKRTRSWKDDKERGVVKKVKRMDGSSSSGGEKGDDENSSDSSDIISPKTPKEGRRQRVFWTEEEEKALIKGVAKYGVGNWVSIHRHYQNKFYSQRTPSDLKDKWRNIQNKKKKQSVDNKEGEGNLPQGMTQGIPMPQGIPGIPQGISPGIAPSLEQQRKMEMHMAEQRMIYEHNHLMQQQQLEQQHLDQMMDNKEMIHGRMETDETENVQQ